MSFNEFTDISLEYPCSYSPWLGETPIHSLVPSDCAYYEEESNGPFIGRSDPLLSSSASNLTTLVFETEKPAEKSTPKVLQPPSLAQLKQEDQLSLITSSLRSFPTENMAIRQEEAEQPQPSFKQESSGNVAFAFKIAANRAPAYFTVKQEATSTPVSVGIRPKASLGSLPSREVEGGVVSAGSDSASSRPCKRSARARSLRAPSMSSIASEDAYDDRDADVNNTDTDDDFDGQDDVERPSRKRSRRKDGSEDMSPCPARLMAINRQLAKLNEMMAEMTPVNVVPAHAKNKCRKERNKLASRACRLKKKASFEANKVKLEGLEQEYERLSGAVNRLKLEVEKRKYVRPHNRLSKYSMVQLWNNIARPALERPVAGRTCDYVSEVLECAGKSTDSDDSESESD